MILVEKRVFLTVWRTFSATMGASGYFGRADWAEGSPAPVKTFFPGPPSGFVVSQASIPSVLAGCRRALTTRLLCRRLLCKEVSNILLLTCLGTFAHSASRLINLPRKERKGKGEGGVQPRVKCSGGVGGLRWPRQGYPGPSQTMGEAGRCQHHREVGLGSLWCSRGGQED